MAKGNIIWAINEEIFRSASKDTSASSVGNYYADGSTTPIVSVWLDDQNRVWVYDVSGNISRSANVVTSLTSSQAGWTKQRSGVFSYDAITIDRSSLGAGSLVGAIGSDLRRSTDGGSTWTNIGTTPNNETLTGLAIDPGYGTAYATYANTTDAPFFQSDDFTTWTSPVSAYPNTWESPYQPGIGYDGVNSRVFLTWALRYNDENNLPDQVGVYYRSGSNWSRSHLISGRDFIDAFYFDSGQIDNVPPVLASARTDGRGRFIILTFNKELDATRRPAASQFTAWRLNPRRALTPTSVTVSGDTVSIGISQTLIGTDEVFVRYIGDTNPILRDKADDGGNHRTVRPFTDRAVVNQVQTITYIRIQARDAANNTTEFSIPYRENINKDCPPPAFWQSGAGTDSDPYVVDYRYFNDGIDIYDFYDGGFTVQIKPVETGRFSFTFSQTANVTVAGSRTTVTANRARTYSVGTNAVGTGINVKWATTGAIQPSAIAKITFTPTAPTTTPTGTISEVPANVTITNSGAQAESTENAYYTTFQWSSSRTFASVGGTLYDTELDQYHFVSNNHPYGTLYWRARFTRSAQDNGTRSGWSSIVSFTRNRTTTTRPTTPVTPVGPKPVALPSASISSGTISGPTSVKSGTTASYTVSVSGVYDSASGTGTIRKTWTSSGRVSASVTVRGLGIKAKSGTSASWSGSLRVTVAAAPSLPNASVNVTGPRVATGVWDTISWSYRETGNFPHGDKIETWTASVTGTGTKAKAGTRASDSYTKRTAGPGHR